MNPVNKMAAINNEVATGLKMNGRDGLTANQSFSFYERRFCRSRRLACER